MPLVCLGLSHKTAPVEVRERHAFPPSRMGEALVALRDYEAVREAIMLSTCGRVEIYAELDDYESGIGQLKRFLGNFGHGTVAASDMESYMYTLLGTEAVEHLFRVATGLDSMLIGEPEILGQVKDAYIQGQRARSLGKSLHKLFREAINAGKAARSQTSIGDKSVSVATAAIEMASEHVGTLEGKTVVVVGAGKMGQTAAKRLKLEGARILVLNRSHERAEHLVADLGTGSALEMPRLIEALKEADVAITSTGASHFILTPGVVAEAMLARPQRALFIVDIAVPRDVDPAVARVPGVAIADIDRLAAIVDTRLELRREAIPLVEEIISEYVERFGDWYQSRLAIPLIASLTQKADALRESELARLFGRCPQLSEREKMLITGMSLTIVSKLLHPAIAKIRAKAQKDRNEALSQARLLDELFDLNIETPQFADVFLETLSATADVD
ncbi:MAG: glutamyl-tRNA reductase [Candidatus Eremiobacteraeota bacterium]|nr:glutamyl-tRNA reductase [Candidatus Eremiobacteraeota bacterium]MBV8354440.1 glutamyl-tRNA reductase [Candidatus Eremiobacteraeota bacterium]